MTDPARDFHWMRPASNILYDEFNTDQVHTVLYNELKRCEVLEQIRMSMPDITPALHVPAGHLGDHLLQALLAIRIKFEQEERRRKVELNIAMRQHSR